MLRSLRNQSNTALARGPGLIGMLWLVGLLGILVWLDGLHDGVFLVPPFAATASILLYLPDVPIAQPIPVVFGSTCGAAIGTAATWIVGFGPVPALVAAVVAAIALPLARIYHPPGVALALYPALLHPGAWFALHVVLPVTLLAVASATLVRRLS